MRRILLTLVGVFLALVSVAMTTAAAQPVPWMAAISDTYGSPIYDAPGDCAATERGPPTNYDHAYQDTAVDHRSDGTLARPSAAETHASYDYDGTVMLAPPDRATGATGWLGRATSGGLSLRQPALIATNPVVRSCLINSFTGDTLVLMADGSRKPIKDVMLGDEVIATNPETGETGPRKVIDLIRHGGLHTMVALGLSDGSTIDATDHHPFWVESREAWVDAIDLQPGDVVVAANGDRLAVESIGISEQDLMAYNLSIDEIHTYFVGSADVLVHNCAMQKSPNAIARAWGYSTRQVKTAIERVKQQPGWRGNGSNRNPDVVVDDATGEVYPKLPDGTPADDSIGNLYDYLPEGP